MTGLRNRDRAARYAGQDLRLAVQRECRTRWRQTLGVEISLGRGLTGPIEFDDWWATAPRWTFLDGERSSFVAAFERYNMLNLPPTRERPDAILKLREIAVLSLLFGFWPNVGPNEEITPAEVIAREERQIEKLAARHGNAAQIYPDPEASDAEGAFIPNLDWKPGDPAEGWLRVKVGRGRRG